MQSFISKGCIKQILFLCCTYKGQYKVCKQHPGMELHMRKCHKCIELILEKFINKYH
jgi:hypothetical protein